MFSRFLKRPSNLRVLRLQSELTKQQNTFKIELKQLEDELLTRLSAAESNFLGDNMLVEKLESTKHTAAEIEMKVLLIMCNPVHYISKGWKVFCWYFIVHCADL